MRSKLLQGVSLGLALSATNSLRAESLIIEAETGTVSAPFSVTNGYLHQTLATGITNGGRAVYEFRITTPGNYQLLANVCAPAGSSNSFFVRINGEPQDPESVWKFPGTSGFVEQLVAVRGTPSPAGPVYTLRQGTHRLFVCGRGADARLDRMTLVKVLDAPPAPPGNLRIVAGP
jgi:hypothetical protein